MLPAAYVGGSNVIGPTEPATAVTTPTSATTGGIESTSIDFFIRSPPLPLFEPVDGARLAWPRRPCSEYVSNLRHSHRDGRTQKHAQLRARPKTFTWCEPSADAKNERLQSHSRGAVALMARSVIASVLLITVLAAAPGALAETAGKPKPATKVTVLEYEYGFKLSRATVPAGRGAFLMEKSGRVLPHLHLERAPGGAPPPPPPQAGPTRTEAKR